MRNHRTWSALCALALCATAAAACGRDGDNVDLRGRQVRLTLLHTADWHSRLFPYNQSVSATDQSLGLQQERAPFGGAARMNWLIQRERARADRVIHLDSGDCFQGAPIFNFFGGEAETRALAHTGVDAVVIGNHEFDRGAGNLYRQFSRWANFPILAANYQLEDPNTPGSAELARITRPYVILNVQGLRVGVIGLANLSSITSIFDQPNRPGITALNAHDITQFYIDQVQAQGADVVVGVSHLGLEDDRHLVETTTGFDVILGGHLHIVLNPTQEIEDCAPFDEQGHFVPDISAAYGGNNGAQRTTTCNPEAECCSRTGVCPPDPTMAIRTGDARYNVWRLAAGYGRRACSPRVVPLQHSGAFMKYLGRLDVVLTDDPNQIGERRLGDGGVGAYNPRNRFEVIGHRFSLFPVDSTVPEEPTMKQMLEPYARALDTLANLDNVVGYSPQGISRTNVNNGDSPMGNLVTTAMWLRLGVQTDFAITNTLGIRDNIPPGAVTIDQVYNVFPFDNSITTLQLSGREVLEMFDFVARRSAGRGCNSQSQISGARVVVNCNFCDRDEPYGVRDQQVNEQGQMVDVPACAETVNIGLARTVTERGTPTGVPESCETDDDCNPDPTTPPRRRSLCEPRARRCMQPVEINASYSLAANDFIAAGGSGFFVLQRNTTQVNTFVQLRDAVIDYVQNANPCGYDPAVAMTYRATHPNDAQRPDDGLPVCAVDGDCAPNAYCSCAERVDDSAVCMMAEQTPSTCAAGTGRCVLRSCRDAMTTLVAGSCPEVNTPRNPRARERCLCDAGRRAAESCRHLACFDESVGAVADGRLRMESR